MRDFPLNEIRMKGGQLPEGFTVFVYPSTTQIFVQCKDLGDLQELERIVDSLNAVEQVLNDVVIFVANETQRFGENTRKPVMSHSMLKTKQMLKKGSDTALDAMVALTQEEMVHAVISSASGHGLSVQKRLEGLSQELERFLRGLIEELRKQDSAKARRFEEKLDKLIQTFRKMDDELALVRSRSEIGQILKKYWAILSEY